MAKSSGKKPKIYIKPSKRGTFTKAAKKSGMSVQAKAASVLSDPTPSYNRRTITPC